MRVAQIMNAKPGEAGLLHDRAPRPVKVRPRLDVVGAGGLAGNYVCADVRQVRENVEGRGIQHDRFVAGLAVG